MSKPEFQPGFRFSAFDLLVLALGITAVVFCGSQDFCIGVAIGFVVLHFFLFCNVFRIPRVPELIWAGVFSLLAAATILIEIPGWIVTFASSLAFSLLLLWRETGKASYHGICWQRWNPGLRAWWDKQHNAVATNETAEETTNQ